MKPATNLERAGLPLPLPRKHATAFGFTMLELVVVVVVIGLLAISAIPLFPSGVDRVGMARRLANDLRLAQSYAMSRGGNYRILSVGTNAYKIQNSTTGTDVTGSQITLEKGSISTFDLLFDNLGGTTAATIVISDGNGSTTVTVTSTGAVSAP